MPIRSLPDRPSLEHLKNQAKALLRRVHAGEADALALVLEFDPQSIQSSAVTDAGGRDAVGRFVLSEAQLVIARSYGFASWQRLRTHLELLETYAEHVRPVMPVDDPPTDMSDDPAALVDYFLNLACINYVRDGYWRLERARGLLTAHPELAAATIHTMTAVGEAEGVRRLLDADPSQARLVGGPFGWEPLLYLTYSRIDTTELGRSAAEVARLLLGAGANPNAGYLWQAHGSIIAFTALTGALGGGEGLQSPHPESVAVARILLEAGADPNDLQALHNRSSGGSTNDIPTMLHNQLSWAAQHGFTERVRLLLDHGVDANAARRSWSPDRTPYELAARAGNREIASLLARAGAERVFSTQ